MKKATSARPGKAISKRAKKPARVRRTREERQWDGVRDLARELKAMTPEQLKEFRELSAQMFDAFKQLRIDHAQEATEMQRLELLGAVDTLPSATNESAVGI